MGIVLWGDGHSHSDWSEGFASLTENTRVYERFEQDFHVATDHLLVDLSRPDFRWQPSDWHRDNFRLNRATLATYIGECTAASTPVHRSIPGIELTWVSAEHGDFGADNAAHVLVREHLERLPEPAFFRGRALRAILRELKEREMRPFLAHINDALPWGDFDGDEMAGLELRHDIEARQPPLGRTGLQYWDAWLSAGKRLSLSGGSDCHQMDLWAGSGLRNAVTVPERSAAAIVAALGEGRSYLASTWHPDVYQELGYAGINPERSGGFTPWWRFGEQGDYDRERARPQVAALIAAALQADHGRVTTACYPTVRFSVNGRGPGETTEPGSAADVILELHMRVPVQQVRLIAQGKPVWMAAPDHGACSWRQEVRLSLRGCRYVRLEALGDAGDGRREYVLSNPVYLGEDAHG